MSDFEDGELYEDDEHEPMSATARRSPPSAGSSRQFQSVS